MNRRLLIFAPVLVLTLLVGYSTFNSDLSFSDSRSTSVIDVSILRADLGSKLSDGIGDKGADPDFYSDLTPTGNPVVYENTREPNIDGEMILALEVHDLGFKSGGGQDEDPFWDKFKKQKRHRGDLTPNQPGPGYLGWDDKRKIWSTGVGTSRYAGQTILIPENGSFAVFPHYSPWWEETSMPYSRNLVSRNCRLRISAPPLTDQNYITKNVASGSKGFFNDKDLHKTTTYPYGNIPGLATGHLVGTSIITQECWVKARQRLIGDPEPPEGEGEWVEVSKSHNAHKDFPDRITVNVMKCERHIDDVLLDLSPVNSDGVFTPNKTNKVYITEKDVSTWFKKNEEAIEGGLELAQCFFGEGLPINDLEIYYNFKKDDLLPQPFLYGIVATQEDLDNLTGGNQMAHAVILLNIEKFGSNPPVYDVETLDPSSMDGVKKSRCYRHDDERIVYQLSNYIFSRNIEGPYICMNIFNDSENRRIHGEVGIYNSNIRNIYINMNQTYKDICDEEMKTYDRHRSELCQRGDISDWLGKEWPTKPSLGDNFTIDPNGTCAGAVYLALNIAYRGSFVGQCP